MSLARAFTTRKGRMSNDLGDSKMPQRSITHKGSAPQSLRTKISGPVQLVHTTNMLSYNAPDLPRSGRSNSVTAKSDFDSDALSAGDSTPPTSPEASPADECPSPQPNHLSSYFIAPGKPVARDLQPESAPAIPKRSPSHTKKNSYDALARQRSVSQMSRDSDRTVSTKRSITFSRSSSTSTRASSTSHVSAQHSHLSGKETPPPIPAVTPLSSPQLQQGPLPRLIPEIAHPFGAELAQVTELAEEYSNAKNALYVIDEDEQYLQSHGLMKLSVDDYMNDVQELFSLFFQQPPKRMPKLSQQQPVAVPAGPMWI
jgi:hypothetical protein